MIRAALALSLLAVAAGCVKSGAEAPPAGTKTPQALPPPRPPSPTEPPGATSPTPPQAIVPIAPAGAGKGMRVEVAVTEEGWVPSRISAKTGEPLTLVITRKTDKTCAKEILFQGQDGKTDLPLGKTVEVTYLPRKGGAIKFGCAMSMMISGVIIVD